ncbi:MAG: hypothetical protein RL596_384 [Bacteroidota bacterium]
MNYGMRKNVIFSKWKGVEIELGIEFEHIALKKHGNVKKRVIHVGV